MLDAAALETMAKSAYSLIIALLLASHSLATPRDARQSDLQNFLERGFSEQTSFEDKFDAEVWLMDMSSRLQRFIKDDAERLHILRAVHREASAANLKPDLVLALIQVESRFDRYALSRVGAQGLMQVMPFWKYEIGRPSDNLTDIDTNLRYGCRILQFYLAREKGNMTKALARYNGSVGKTWYPKLVMNAWYGYWIAGTL